VWSVLKGESSQRDTENKDGMEGVGRDGEAPGLQSSVQQAVCTQTAQREGDQEALCEGHWGRWCSTLRKQPGVETALRGCCPTL